MKISSIEENERLQADINHVIQWTTENEMLFRDRFQLFTCGRNENQYKKGNINEHHYIIQDERKRYKNNCTVSDDLTFTKPNKANLNSENIIGSSHCTFKIRKE